MMTPGTIPALCKLVSAALTGQGRANEEVSAARPLGLTPIRESIERYTPPRGVPRVLGTSTPWTGTRGVSNRSWLGWRNRSAV